MAVALSPGCRRQPRHPQGPASPQAVLERQLINSQHRLNKRTRDGGILYTTDFTAASSESLRVPYDLLKLECESHGASFEPSEPPPETATAIATKADQGQTPGIPEGIHASLRDADARQLFGRHVCLAGVYLWHADLEPTLLTPTRDPNTFRFQVYVKAVSAPDYDPQAPTGPGLPATGPSAQRAAGWPPPSAAGEAAAPGPTSGPGARATSPLDPRPSRPTPTGDQLLADPHPFGVIAGVDSPEALAQKLGLPLETAAHCDGPGLIGLCWEHPGGSEATSLRAMFAELGASPSLAELEVHYPASAFTWLSGMLSNLLGPADVAAPTSLQWSWLHTNVELSVIGQNDVRVYVAHKPSLDRARLPSGSPARTAKSVAAAAPWQLSLGYEAAQAAQAKLQSAGFSIAPNGCVDGGTATRPFTRTCSLQVKQVPGVTSAWVRNVDIGDGRARLAELGYQLDRAKLKDLQSELTAQYGEPIPSTGDALQWWTGSVGITLTGGSGKDLPTLRYYHGRLLQFFIVAEARRAAATPARP